NVLIDMILGNSPAAKICAELVRLAEDEKITIVLSVLCYTEVRGYPNKKPYPPELDKKCLDFFDNARLLIVDVNRRVSLVARRPGCVQPLRGVQPGDGCGREGGRVDDVGSGFRPRLC